MSLKSASLLYLGLIFIFAIFLRLLFFPDNVYFGFDQARDAFASLEIMKGDIKLVGPTTSFPPIRHGVIYYYLFAPIYFLFQGNPEAVSLFMRILNALGIFFAFYIGKTIFNSKVGLLSALLFAISFEQTQFALFLNHPAFVVITLQVFYLGLALWIFKQKNYGLWIALIGLALSFQFEFVEIQLLAILFVYLLFFHKKLPKITINNLLFAIASFLVPLLPYLISEIKYQFPLFRGLFIMITQKSTSTATSNLSDVTLILTRFFHDNFISLTPLDKILPLIFLGGIFVLLRKKEYQKQIIFLLIWFFGGFLIYFFVKNDAYFYNTGTSISLLILGAFFLYQLFAQNKIFYLLIALLVVSNLSLIVTQNPLGPNERINPQKGLTLANEKKVLDYIYQEANQQPFAVNAITMPFNINTTWSYLFEWYGKSKYGYLPIWSGNTAQGYAGNLTINTNQKEIPNQRFLIIEPKEGIPSYLIDGVVAEQNIFTTTTKKAKFDTIEVWSQKLK